MMEDHRVINLVPPNAEYVLAVDPECAAEIQTIVKKSGAVVRFAKDYNSRLRQLLEYRENAPMVNGQWFERLKYSPSQRALYSMHLANIGNMRILYVIGRTIIFLCAFKEKEGGGRKRQSYSQYIPIAEKRLERHKEDL